MLTQKRLKELLHYSPSTGIFTHVTNTTRKRKGDIAGSDDGRRYLRININRKEYTLHRLAFLYMTGAFPEFVVDHINQNSTDNSWGNLRDVPQKVNLRNALMCTNNWSGVKGVRWNKKEWYWMVSVGNSHVGCFKTMDEAVNALLIERERQGFSITHGNDKV